VYLRTLFQRTYNFLKVKLNLFIMASYEGTLQPFIMNLVLWYMGVGHLASCMYFGGWGLIIGNDDGVLMEQCLNTALEGVIPTWYEWAWSRSPYCFDWVKQKSWNFGTHKLHLSENRNGDEISIASAKCKGLKIKTKNNTL